MRYTKGIKGPESTHRLDVQSHHVSGTNDNPMLKMTAYGVFRKGPRMVRLIAQGRHAQTLLEQGVDGEHMLTIRWTASDAATVTAVAEKAAKAA